MKRVFLDMDGTIARFNVRNALLNFNTKEGFFTRLLPYAGIENINTLAKSGNIYIISASPNARADNDKLEWLKKHIPNIPNENITICRLGENKAELIKQKYNITLNSNCILLDDYTKNLREWEECGGTGIKRLTSVSDNSRRLWKGQTLKHLKELEHLLTWQTTLSSFYLVYTLHLTCQAARFQCSRAEICQIMSIYSFYIEHLFDLHKLTIPKSVK